MLYINRKDNDNEALKGVGCMITIKQFKQQLQRETGLKLDFRVHGYMSNNYGLVPIYNYDTAMIINDYIFKHHSNRRVANKSIELEKLRTIKLNDYIENVLFLNSIELNNE